MAQSHDSAGSQDKTSSKAYTYKVESGLFFNLIPINKENIGEWNQVYSSLESKCVRNSDGYWIFGDILGRMRGDTHLDTYAFIASDKPYNPGHKLSDLSLEMMMAVSVDQRGHLSQHLGIQRYEVEHKHPQIAIKVHSFCAGAVKALYPETTHMVTNPLKIMREMLIKELGEVNITLIHKRTWKETEFYLEDGSKLELGATLPEILGIMHPGNSPGSSTPQTIVSLDKLSGLCPELDVSQMQGVDIIGEGGEEDYTDSI